MKKQANNMAQQVTEIIQGDKTGHEMLLETGIDLDKFKMIRRGTNLTLPFNMGNTSLNLRLLSIKEEEQASISASKRIKELPETLRLIPKLFNATSQNIENQELIKLSLETAGNADFKSEKNINFLTQNELNYLIRCYNELNNKYNVDYEYLTPNQVEGLINELKKLDNEEDLKRDLLMSLSQAKLAQLTITLNDILFSMDTQEDN